MPAQKHSPAFACTVVGMLQVTIVPVGVETTVGVIVMVPVLVLFTWKVRVVFLASEQMVLAAGAVRVRLGVMHCRGTRQCRGCRGKVGEGKASEAHKENDRSVGWHSHSKRRLGI